MEMGVGRRVGGRWGGGGGVQDRTSVDVGVQHSERWLAEEAEPGGTDRSKWITIA